jgi:hypothetical protein
MGVAWSAQQIPTAVNLGFLEQSRYISIQVAPQLSSRGWLDPVQDPLLLRKSCSSGNRTRDLRICSQELWLLDHREKQRKLLPRVQDVDRRTCIWTLLNSMFIIVYWFQYIIIITIILIIQEQFYTPPLLHSAHVFPTRAITVCSILSLCELIQEFIAETFSCT